jgi:hypothetical protein
MAGYHGILGHRDYGGLLETCRYYRLGRGEVENVSEETCHLVNALRTESVITQSFRTAGALMHGSVLLVSK